MLRSRTYSTRLFFLSLILIVVGCAKKSTGTETTTSSTLILPLEKGPFQDNGASPWYSIMGFGTPAQQLKFGMDTGNNGVWVTSTQCTTEACTQSGRVRFDPNASSTFSWITKESDTLSFGPWGDMLVNQGQDYFSVGETYFKSTSKVLLSTEYDSVKFEELNWDGGIGFPSQNSDKRISYFVEQLINDGAIDTADLQLSFYCDLKTGTGEIRIGNIDSSKVDLSSKLTFPFVQYSSVVPSMQSLDYLWTTPIQEIKVGHSVIATNKLFCFDTGASDFKGDTSVVLLAKRSIENFKAKYGSFPKMELNFGIDINGQVGKIILDESQYQKKIEAGEGAGEEILTFDDLELEDLILVGSVLLDNTYTVFDYYVTGEQGNYTLHPKNMVLYNKKEGTKVIVTN
ncbi:MAG: A1 family peptidase [Cyclobacteriaceae bacterium]